MSKKSEIVISPKHLRLDVAIGIIKKMEEQISWETPGLEDFIMMNEMRSIIKGLGIPEETIGEA